MCYGNPRKLLQQLVESKPNLRNPRGHTPGGDFVDFCHYSGLNESQVGPVAFAWAKYAYISVWFRRLELEREIEKRRWGSASPPAGNPQELVRQLVQGQPGVRNALGHTPDDDFEHFCSYSGLHENEVGSEGFAWAKYAYFSVWFSKLGLERQNEKCRQASAALVRVADLGARGPLQ
jgi:hypothetical protein